MRDTFRHLAARLLASFLTLSTVACRKTADVPAPAVPQVSVSFPLTREIIEWDEYPGALESPQTVTLAARISGIIVQAPFEEGSAVQQGDVLFVIDDRPFKAELASKAADVAKAQAQVAQAHVHFNRYSKIRGTKAISAEDYDQALAALRQAQAQLEASRASEEVAKLNVEWTQVRAPITGRVSRKLVTEGNLVNGGAGQATPLTVINSVDPLYCYVTVPENAFLRYRAQLAERKETDEGQGSIPCSFQLENEKGFPHSGRVDFVDSKVDRNTGTILIRGVMPNPSATFASGLFARMRIPGSMPYNAVLVPDASINSDQNSRNVLVVGRDELVEQRKVKLGPLLGRMRVILEGVAGHDRVIVNGMLAARPGTKVAATEIPIPPDLLVALEPFLASTPAEKKGSQR